MLLKNNIYCDYIYIELTFMDFIELKSGSSGIDKLK